MFKLRDKIKLERAITARKEAEQRRKSIEDFIDLLERKMILEWTKNGKKPLIKIVREDNDV